MFAQGVIWDINQSGQPVPIEVASLAVHRGVASLLLTSQTRVNVTFDPGSRFPLRTPRNNAAGGVSSALRHCRCAQPLSSVVRIRHESRTG